MSPGGGLLVTLDGPSGVGKTTVSGLIRDRLAAAGVPVVLTTTPSRSSLGELARARYQPILRRCTDVSSRSGPLSP